MEIKPTFQGFCRTSYLPGQQSPSYPRRHLRLEPALPTSGRPGLGDPGRTPGFYTSPWPPCQGHSSPPPHPPNLCLQTCQLCPWDGAASRPSCPRSSPPRPSPLCRPHGAGRASRRDRGHDGPWLQMHPPDTWFQGRRWPRGWRCPQHGAPASPGYLPKPREEHQSQHHSRWGWGGDRWQRVARTGTPRLPRGSPWTGSGHHGRAPGKGSGEVLPGRAPREGLPGRAPQEGQPIPSLEALLPPNPGHPAGSP